MFGQEILLERNPALARQIELLKLYRAGDT
jgi:hypothetical protein